MTNDAPNVQATGREASNLGSTNAGSTNTGSTNTGEYEADGLREAAAPAVGGSVLAAGVCGPCGFVNEAGSKFCEDCGKPLDQSGVVTAARECSACSSTTFDNDGYCQECGTKAPSPRDHAVMDFGVLATVTDRGISHPINQDAVACALFVGSEIVSLNGGIETLDHPMDSAGAPGYDRLSTRAVLVVCDGVSTSSASDVASAAAVSVANIRLQQCVATEPELAVSALIDAAKLAQSAVSSTPFRKTVGLDAPSCTFVAATVANGRITVGNIGDSRAYVFGDDGQDLHLSADDSWAAEEIRTGRRTPENA